jgi:hypothetical protein
VLPKRTAKEIKINCRAGRWEWQVKLTAVAATWPGPLPAPLPPLPPQALPVALRARVT